MLGKVTQPPAGLAKRFSQIKHARMARAWNAMSAVLVLGAFGAGYPTRWLPLIRFVPYTLLIWETWILHICTLNVIVILSEASHNPPASTLFHLVVLLLLYMQRFENHNNRFENRDKRFKNRDKLAQFDLCLYGFLGYWVPWHLALWDLAWWGVDCIVAPRCRRGLALDYRRCSVGVDSPTMDHKPNNLDQVLGVEWLRFRKPPTGQWLTIPNGPSPTIATRINDPDVYGGTSPYCKYMADTWGRWPMWLQNLGYNVHYYRFGYADHHNHPVHPRTNWRFGVDTSGRLFCWPACSGPMGLGGAVWPIGRMHVWPDTLLFAADYLVALETIHRNSGRSGSGFGGTLLEVQGLTSAQPVRFAWFRGHTTWRWAIGNTLIVVARHDAPCTEVFGDDKCTGYHLVAVPLAALIPPQRPGSLPCVDGPWSVCLTASAKRLVLTDDQTVRIVCVGFESKKHWICAYAITDTGLRGHDAQRETQSTGECICLGLAEGQPMHAYSTPLTVPGVPWGVARVVLRAEAEAVRAALAGPLGPLGSLPDTLVRLVTGYLYP